MLVKLKDLIVIKNGGDYKHLSKGNIPVYGTGGIMTYVDKCLYDKEAILLPRKGSLNNVMYVNRPFWTVDTMFFAIPKYDKVNARYLYYHLSLIDFTRYDVGSTIPSMTASLYYSLTIDIPSLEIQNKIADLFTQIDNQIELNNFMVKKLQVLTRAIYQQWFLQFEFINAEGKPYKKCGGTFEFNPVLKTEIPTGWTVRKIKNCIKHINTGLNPRDNFVLNDGNINYITVKNLTTDGTIDFSGCDTISKQTKELIRKRSMVSKGDILFASIAPLGRCVIVAKTPDDWEINESVFSIRPNTQVVSTEYLYMFLMSDYFIKKAEHGSIGSVFNGIRISFLEDMDILIPPQTVIEEFTKRVAPLFSKRHQLVENGRILNSIKATLLPLLINGQLE